MSDRHQGHMPTVSGRTSTYNPARSSVPTNVGYSSMYAGDMHVVPCASHSHHITPRGYSTSVNAAGVPTTTRVYAVVPEPRALSKTRDSSRPRRSTLDSSSRPPVIITTTQLERPHVSSSSSSSSHAPNNGRSGSPIRDDYRASDSQVYSQSASSVRSRSSSRPYHAAAAAAAASNANSGRYRERADGHLSTYEVESYRSSRPSVAYPSDPRHSMAAIDYGDEGYQYTNAGELVKYDLDHSKPGRLSKRQDSLDAGYYRPNIHYDSDRRNFNVNTTHDLNRPPAGPSRPIDSRGGPPPSTRGFDRINRSYDARDAPLVIPVPPLGPSTVPQFERPGSAGGRRPRPLSLHQEGGLRSSHHDDCRRTREDERHMRDLRDRDRDRDYERRSEPSRYQDDSVASRGFGIRTDLPSMPPDARDRWRDTRLDKPRRRSDEDLCYGHDKDKDGRRRSRFSLVEDLRGLRPDGRAGSEEGQDRSERSRVRDSLATGLGAVATAMGLMPAVFKSQDKRDHEPSLQSRRRGSPEERDAHAPSDASRMQHRAQEPMLTPHERPRDMTREKESVRDNPPLMIRERDPAQDRDPLREVIREKEPVREREYVRESEPFREREYGREWEPVKNDGRNFNEPGRRPYTDAQIGVQQAARQSGSDSDDTKRTRRNRTSNSFDPNDASDLRQLKEQLASMDVADRRRDRDTDRPVSTTEKPRVRSRSPPKDRASHGSPKGLPRNESGDEARGRESASPGSEGKQVRVVSPPREKSDGKPLRGILKQPKASFPEEENPVREGVAPHKEDKKLKEVPPGARWTKINRKIVNPEALTIGKERFEVRDDFVIVLRVLSKEEIQAYAAATQVLRERRRNKHDEDKDRDENRDRSIDADDDGEDAERHRRHRRPRDGDEGDEGSREGKRDHERRKAQRQDDQGDLHGRSKDADNQRHGPHNPRSFKERERELEANG
ncbi:hypothetical protein E4U42_005418 [Claviceps africana]|uniref:DUF8035 domain-containing protein n=1 Tax=Claviceps africana TaxID=83212 RepID=A0A8K0J4C4_9HYPO|nr:hypothetical protein E4U42_005418 [Claviceps africana]